MIFAGASRACLGKYISEQTQCHYIYGSIYIEICVCVCFTRQDVVLSLISRSFIHLFLCVWVHVYLARDQPSNKIESWSATSLTSLLFLSQPKRMKDKWGWSRVDQIRPDRVRLDSIGLYAGIGLDFMQIDRLQTDKQPTNQTNKQIDRCYPLRPKDW